MQLYQVVGRSNYSFTNAKGEVIDGYTYHLVSTVDETTDNFVGRRVASEAALKSKVDGWARAGSFVPKLGDVVLVVYSRNGKLDSFMDGSLFEK